MKGCVALLVILLVQILVLEFTNGDVYQIKRKPRPRHLKKIWVAVSKIRKRNQEFGPQLLRLAFHSCVGLSCNACVDPTNPENKGFEEVIEAVDKLYDNPRVHQFMSKADLIAFALLNILHSAIRRHDLNCRHFKECSVPTPKYEFWWGRKDECEHIYTKVNNTPNGFPHPRLSRAEMMEWFRKDFNFSEEEVTVLMGGAHSMGGTHKEVSGYEGNFTRPGLYGKVFHNKVFKRLTLNKTDLRNEPNLPDDKDEKFYQFNAFGPRGGLQGMLLNPEVVAAYDIPLDPLEGTKCKLNNVRYHRKGEKPVKPDHKQEFCKHSPTWDLAYKYATDEQAFINDFFAVLLKMLAYGNEGKLHKLELHYIEPLNYEDFRDK